MGKLILCPSAQPSVLRGTFHATDFYASASAWKDTSAQALCRFWKQTWAKLQVCACMPVPKLEVAVPRSLSLFLRGKSFQLLGGASKFADVAHACMCASRLLCLSDLNLPSCPCLVSIVVEHDKIARQVDAWKRDQMWTSWSFEAPHIQLIISHYSRLPGSRKIRSWFAMVTYGN